MGLTRRVYVVTEVDVTRSQKNCVQLYNLMEGGDKLLHNTVSKPADIPQNVLLLQLNGPNCCEHSEEGLWAGVLVQTGEKESTQKQKRRQEQHRGSDI